MLSKEEKALAEKVVSGGGTTGQSMTADTAGGTATLPNSKKQSDPMPKIVDPSNTAVEETPAESNVKPTGDNSASNKASIAMKTGVMAREELQQIFGDEVSAEFIDKVATVFEAAVAVKVDEIEQSYAATLDEEVASIREELSSKADEYLSFVAQEWLTENEVAIETSLKNELTEEFIEGMKNLFKEHYMEIPSDKVDVLETLSTKVEELEARLNESVNSSMELQSELARYQKQEVFADVAEGLALTQVEKFRTIAESLDATDVDAYKKKLETVKETYFSGKTASTSNILTEEFDGETSAAPAVTGEMALYAATISRTLKK